MKHKFLLSLFLIFGLNFCVGQSSNKLTPVSLSAACTNATTTCDGTANSQLKFGVGDYSMASVTGTGTFTGATVNFEFSDDGGTTWYTTTCTRNDASVQENSEAIPNSTSRSWDCGTSAAGMFRIRLGAISTGSLTVGATQSAAQIEPAPTVSLSLPTGSFAVFSNPAAGSQATIAAAAAGAGIKNVATLVCFSAAATTAPVATALTINLRDGATGAGTVKWTQQVVVTATTGQLVQPFCAPVNVIGSANTAMTLEFSASLANLIESVSLQGYTTNF
jgi:hypothetical protein